MNQFVAGRGPIEALNKASAGDRDRITGATQWPCRYPIEECYVVGIRMIGQRECLMLFDFQSIAS
jgi:hypothetical protein